MESPISKFKFQSSNTRNLVRNVDNQNEMTVHLGFDTARNFYHLMMFYSQWAISVWWNSTRHYVEYLQIVIG